MTSFMDDLLIKIAYALSTDYLSRAPNNVDSSTEGIKPCLDRDQVRCWSSINDVTHISNHDDIQSVSFIYRYRKVINPFP